MNLYKNVINIEVFKFGFDYNVCYEFGKLMLLEELMFLFRKELFKLMIEEEVVFFQFLNLRLWKEVCVLIFGIMKIKLYNVYYCMLVFCFFLKEGWVYIEGFVFVWNRNRIKR